MTSARTNRFGLIFGAAVLAVAPVAIAQTPDAESQTAVRATPADIAAQTVARLSRPISLELTDVRLEDIIQFLKDFTGAEIEALWLDDRNTDGLDKDQRVTIAVKDVRAIDFIERLIEKVKSDFSPVTWQFSRTGGLEIGPKSRLNKGAYLRVYDIQDMLFQIPNFANAPELNLDQVLNQGQQGGGGGGGSIFREQGTNEAQDEKSAQELADEIRGLITAYVEPDQWQDNGGDGGTITYFDGHFLIRAPEYMHRALLGSPFEGRSGTPVASPRSAGPETITNRSTAGSPPQLPQPPPRP